MELEVISSEEEADLAAEGCAPLIGRRYRGALVFDIGGGSTEVILLRKSPQGPRKTLAASVPVGVVSLAESYGAASTSRAGFTQMQADLTSRFEPHARQMARDFDARHYHLLGTSGTVTTLAAIALKLPRYNRTRVDASWHETAQMLRVVERLMATGCRGAGQDRQHRHRAGRPDAAGLAPSSRPSVRCGRRRCCGLPTGDCAKACCAS